MSGGLKFGTDALRFSLILQAHPGKDIPFRGETSKVEAQARLYRVKDDRMLVVSLYPASLRSKLRLKHLEVRYLVSEGFLDEVKIAVITLKPESGYLPPGKEDSFALKEKGRSFLEEFPERAALKLSAFDARPGKRSFNAACVHLAQFADWDLQKANFGYALRGVTESR